MKPVETERRFSVWWLLVPGVEPGAGRQVAQAGGSCWPWLGQRFGPQLCSSQT